MLTQTNVNLKFLNVVNVQTVIPFSNTILDLLLVIMKKIDFLTTY